jgi:Phage integrase family
MQRAGPMKVATCHALRHFFVTDLHEAGYDIRTVQVLLGHKDVKTSMAYNHVLTHGGVGVRSPVDSLWVTGRSKHRRKRSMTRPSPTIPPWPAENAHPANLHRGGVTPTASPIWGAGLKPYSHS